MPKVVAIDAPLFLPLGRKNLRKSKIHLRACDKELLKMKIKFFPISIGPMRSLTKRGISLRKKLEKMKIKVIETFPGGVYDILGINRKSPAALKKFIKFNPKGKKIHEIDAIACAYVAKLYFEGKVRKIGKKGEGYMYIPKVFKAECTY
jgi:predicted nuclease with RNAse H fold